ncbi:hypothetical protein Pcinc_037962 [Petrolisthes cinctipes]|uniref:Uncharacterized protein n=1 Tax=Petrolisthes cinctipes TaxID=88211 RepID=A0AAE1BRF9_PETCI|nr:hypothetical protein Pcinc_037962 [Petrolisthes cinctipes]
MERGDSQVEGGGSQVEGGGSQVEGGGSQVEGGGSQVEGGAKRRKREVTRTPAWAGEVQTAPPSTHATETLHSATKGKGGDTR